MPTVTRRESIESVLRKLWAETEALATWVPVSSVFVGVVQSDDRITQDGRVLYVTFAVESDIAYRSTTRVGYLAALDVVVHGEDFDDCKNLVEVLRQYWDAINRPDWTQVVRRADSDAEPTITDLRPVSEPQIEQDDDDLWAVGQTFGVRYSVPFGPTT